MAKSLIILVLCIASVYSDTEVKMEMAKDMMSEKVEESSMSDTEMAMDKQKRDSWPYHGPTPCPPSYPHYHQPAKVQYISQPQYLHKPTVTVVKTPSYSGWQSNPWQQSYGYSKPSYGWEKPSYGWSKPSYGWGKPSYGWPVQSHGWQAPVYQPKVIVQKPAYSYTPMYHQSYIKPAAVVKPDCPPYNHYHSPHGGIVYAPQYNHQPVVKVIKPAYQQPYYHQPHYHQPIHVPKVEICH